MLILICLTFQGGISGVFGKPHFVILVIRLQLVTANCDFKVLCFVKSILLVEQLKRPAVCQFEEASENVGWKMADLLVQNSNHHFKYLASPTFYTYRYTSLLCV